MSRSLRLIDVQNILRKKSSKKIGFLALLLGVALFTQNCADPSENFFEDESYTWQFVNPTNIPANAVHSGFEKSLYPNNTELMDVRPLYICRVTGYPNRSGKVGPSGECHIPTRYGVDFSTQGIANMGTTIAVDDFTQFEVLVPALGKTTEWVNKMNYPRQENGEYPDSLVRVDDNENSPLICSVYHRQMREDDVSRSGMHPGFVDERIGKCVFSWNGGVGSLDQYSVLTVNNQP